MGQFVLKMYESMLRIKPLTLACALILGLALGRWMLSNWEYDRDADKDVEISREETRKIYQ
jgi:hypothetical protein